MEKYTKAIKLMNAVNSESVDVCKQWDKLYKFLHANFPVPTASYKVNPDLNSSEIKKLISDDDKKYINECTQLLRVDKSDDVLAKITKLPPEYSDLIFPVAIARYLLAYKKVYNIPNFSINNLKTFSEFHARYGILVVESVQD